MPASEELGSLVCSLWCVGVTIAQQHPGVGRGGQVRGKRWAEEAGVSWTDMKGRLHTPAAMLPGAQLQCPAGAGCSQ